MINNKFSKDNIYKESNEWWNKLDIFDKTLIGQRLAVSWTTSENLNENEIYIIWLKYCQEKISDRLTQAEILLQRIKNIEDLWLLSETSYENENEAIALNSMKNDINQFLIKK